MNIGLLVQYYSHVEVSFVKTLFPRLLPSHWEYIRLYFQACRSQGQIFWKSSCDQLLKETSSSCPCSSLESACCSSLQTNSSCSLFSTGRLFMLSMELAGSCFAVISTMLLFNNKYINLNHFCSISLQISFLLTFSTPQLYSFFVFILTLFCLSLVWISTKLN